LTQIKAPRPARHHASDMESVLETPATRPGRPPRAIKERSLAPREHGAYGQLLFPLVVAHVTARPNLAGALFTVAALAAFLGHEPWLVLLGRRGPRITRELRPRARRVLGLCATVALASMIGGLAVAPPGAWHAMLLPAVLTPVVALFIAWDAERTLVGELVVAATLPALAVPIAIAGHVEPSRAFASWAVWTLGSAAATGAVRAVIAHLKQPLSALQRAALPLGVLGAAGVLSALQVLDAKAIVALVPMLEVTAVAALLAPHPRHLKTVGWALVVATAITGVLLCL
jgi:hypothetical protein